MSVYKQIIEDLEKRLETFVYFETGNKRHKMPKYIAESIIESELTSQEYCELCKHYFINKGTPDCHLMMIFENGCGLREKK